VSRKHRSSKKSSVWIFTGALAILIIGALSFMIWGNYEEQTTKDSVPPVIDGIECNNMEGAAMHIHAHLTIINNGTPVPVPAQIGILPKYQCLYWIHTHDATGEIHMESPTQRSFTLGNFFDVWGQPLTNDKVANYMDGKELKVYVDGKPYLGNPRNIALKSHTRVVLEVGPNFVPPPNMYQFPPGD
jgi:hypothetical protein